MPRSIWKGSISFGLVTIPVRLYGASEDKDVSFHQVHSTDGGRIRYQRVCEVCGEVVQFADIAKGFEAGDGRLAVLTDDDFANLPLSTLKTVDVVQFVAEGEVDPRYFQRSYFLEAEAVGQKPYVLLRDALARENRVAVVKVALRSRESLALIRPKDDLLLLHTMFWPDELRDGSFAAPPAEVSVSEAEIEMAKLLIAQLEGTFDPEAYTDSYRETLLEVVEAKLAGAAVPEATDTSAPVGDVVDLMAALRASVDAAKKRRAAAEATKAG
ncbi:DNA end-binding protein Ku [Tessaracoccus bendigoensis DSM 12906]|uniref:Non-homologous end joining protein Ku n=1 Tax=Tessaracoccus bendigoensis DSM 12906 TaxID=1123357 RepID=A0A1M6AHZ9_9ACTN|nr:Ku protein [Tessaracoccus bendigoensis]SHI36082.1 DNA end-binding protein Ku [Tessaracoccus bendigoensis DSM 12906]